LSLYRFNRIALALVFAVSASLHAQQVTPRDLPKPVKEIEDPFSMIAGALELKSGQVIMIDMAEMDLVLVDFTKGTRTILGRKGSGPGEYRAPQAMMVVPGDSLWVFDAGQMRFASWGPDMKAGATIPMMTFDQTTGTALTSPMVGDRKGRFYASSMKMEMGRSGGAGGRGGNVQMSIPDSVGVVRVDPRNPETRTELARVKFPVSGKPEMKQLGERNLKYTLQFPGLVAADAWAVFPDGRVAIVRGARARRPRDVGRDRRERQARGALEAPGQDDDRRRGQWRRLRRAHRRGRLPVRPADRDPEGNGGPPVVAGELTAVGGGI
jgi:hypothetical protein